MSKVYENHNIKRQAKNLGATVGMMKEENVNSYNNNKYAKFNDVFKKNVQPTYFQPGFVYPTNSYPDLNNTTSNPKAKKMNLFF